MEYDKKSLTKINSFLKSVKNKNLSQVYKHCQITWKSNNSKKILQSLVDMELVNYDVLLYEKVTDVAIKFIVSLEFRQAGKFVAYPMVICEKSPYEPSLKGTWGVNPISILRMIKDDGFKKP